MSEQNEWRYCGKCHVLFFDGYPDKGVCAAGGGNEAIGYNFVLPYDVPGTSTTQDAWRYCGKCHGMFYDGYADKGRCAAGGGHEAAGYNFVLPHDIQGTATAQTDWRYCGKCHGMFYDGYSDKGRCAAGGGHEAIGYNFALPHPIHPAVHLQDRVSNILVAGSGFTPNSQVKIFYEYRDSFGLITNGADNPLFSSTETDGSFAGAGFNLNGSGTIAYINVKVVDNVTNQEAVASLRGDA